MGGCFAALKSIGTICRTIFIKKSMFIIPSYKTAHIKKVTFVHFFSVSKLKTKNYMLKLQDYEDYDALLKSFTPGSFEIPRVNPGDKTP
jgi:hypothetical protein